MKTTDVQTTQPVGPKEGGVFFMIIMILAALSVVGGTVFVVTTTDLRITANYKTGVEAFNHADSGIQYIKDLIDQDLRSGALTLLNPVETVNYLPPDGFNFDGVTSLVRTGNTNAYVFEVTGRSNDSEATVEAVIHRRPLMEFGLFGDEEVDMKAFGNVFSYNSTVVPNPTPDDSDGDGDTASNEEFITHMGTLIDGHLALGENESGDPGEWASTGTPDISGDAGLLVGRIDPDPLGAVGGALAGEFTLAQAHNDNGSASPAIPGSNRVRLGNGDVMTVTAGDYYLNDLTLNNGASLIIDASAGPVDLYLAGGMEAKNGSSINILGNPTDFRLLSNSTEDIVLKHNGLFKGLIYAPDAFVEVKNGADFYGVVWAEEAEIKNSGDFYIDTALLTSYWDSSVYLASWKEFRND